LLGENGCPWDKSQTFESLREDLIEECYEAVDAVNKGDAESLREELGDVMLTVMLYAKISEKNGGFTINEIINGVTEKIIRRHSHVFGDKRAVTPEESLANWDAEKRAEKGFVNQTERLADVPRALPALMRAQKILKRAAGSDVIKNKSCARAEELAGLAAKIGDRVLSGAGDDLPELIGGILLCIAEISRFFEINAELALTNSAEKFINVFANAENVAMVAFDAYHNL